MPVKLTKTTRPEGNQSCSKSLGDWKVGRVNVTELAGASWDWGGRLLQSTVDICAVAGELSITARGLKSADASIKDIWIRSGYSAKDRGINTKVLGNDVFGSMSKPVINHKGCSDFVKVTLVKDKEIFILIFKALDGVCNTLGEIPGG
jgi:hypothetical protein